MPEGPEAEERATDAHGHKCDNPPRSEGEVG